MQDGNNTPSGSTIPSLPQAGLEEEESIRRRRFHRRSRNGCQHCKKRRVRCDEGRPVCGNCVRKKEEHMCHYPLSMMSDIHDPSASTSNTPEARPNDGSSSSTPSNRIEQNIAIDAVGTQPVTGYPPATQHQHLNHLSAIDFSNLDSLLSAANNNSIETSGLTPPFLPTSLDDLFVQMPNWLLNSNIGVDAPVTSQASIQPFDDSLQPAPSSQQNGVDVVFDQSNSLVSYQPASAWASSSNTAISKSDHPIDIIRQPDALAAYFPSPEQRHLFRHFVNETAPDLLVTPVPPSNNPWLTHFANLALGQASGTDVAHDAFRLALLSLASFDMGMKMDSTLRCKEENAMYALSEEHRTSAMNILEMGKIVGKAPVQVEGDSNSADLTLGVAIALGIRDRLAGTQDWEKPIALGTQVVLDHQGPAKYIAESPTKERRFLVEQMACIEMLGMMTIFYAPTILAWDNDWLFDVPSGDSQDHLHLIYGWDRRTLQMCARTVILGDQSRQIEFLKSGNAEFNFPAVTAKIQEMDRALTDRGDRLLREVQSLRVEELSLQSSRALRGIRTLLPCMEISLIAGDLCQADMNQEHIQSKVSAVLDTVEEAISQGMYAGFLLPLLWMSIFSVSDDNKRRVTQLMVQLQPHYHLEPGLLKRLIYCDWSEYVNAGYDQWEKIMRRTNTYVPVF